MESIYQSTKCPICEGNKIVKILWKNDPHKNEETTTLRCLLCDSKFHFIFKVKKLENRKIEYYLVNCEFDETKN